MMKAYIASVRDKDTKQIILLKKEYETKKQFIQDIKGNGYRLRFVATADKFDEECEKYYRRSEEAKELRRFIRQLGL